MPETEHIRNFTIIAHIDHGKSTLADRILELTDTVSGRAMKAQVLDNMELERERGVTIKAKAIRIHYQGHGGRKYVLNLIDTPGHVDFGYEVSRSLAAAEGALLVVDAAQGVEAQTVANTHLAKENNLKLIPVINKIDLPQADPDRVRREIAETLGVSRDPFLVSAKTGEGVPELLEAIVAEIPAPSGEAKAPLKALIFDSFYHTYRGVVVSIRVFEGQAKAGMQVNFMASGYQGEVAEVGTFRLDLEPADALSAGEVGYLIAGIKEVKQTKVGDTVTEVERPTAEPLPGYRQVKPMVFCGLFPIEGGEYDNLRQALDRLRLNDPALLFEPEDSPALGFGFRCGFLGLFHLDIVRERLEREYDLELVATAPSVAYKISTAEEVLTLRNPSNMPSSAQVQKIEEPYISATFILPSEYVGPVMELCQERRGEFKDIQHLSTERVKIVYELPLSETLFDFFGQLKARTRGYGSFDYEPLGFREGDLVRLDVLLAGQPIDAFSAVVPRRQAQVRGRELVERLKKAIPRQMFDVPVQAAVGSRVIARETIKAQRKDVLSKCYGGDVSRKRKLLARQKAGKKKLKMIGQVEVPQEAFLSMLGVDDPGKK